MTRAKSEGPRGVTLRTRAPLETHLSQPPASLPCDAHLACLTGRLAHHSLHMQDGLHGAGTPERRARARPAPRRLAPPPLAAMVRLRARRVRERGGGGVAQPAPRGSREPRVSAGVVPCEVGWPHLRAPRSVLAHVAGRRGRGGRATSAASMRRPLCAPPLRRGVRRRRKKHEHPACTWPPARGALPRLTALTHPFVAAQGLLEEQGDPRRSVLGPAG